jgi:hypothetical protein
MSNMTSMPQQRDRSGPRHTIFEALAGFAIPKGA